ncbi:conserved membrane hypothetical protein [Tenacibaculum sp. 190524A05c]|uniref:hypothetical protein n=1 Tax=Tenacibaculum platacis TaxID=3137852 RepID=UPI0031FAC0F6
MTQKLLEAKHWQLFFLTFGIPMIVQILMMGFLFINAKSSENLDPSFIFGFMQYFPILMILFMGVLLGWFWSVVTGLQKVIPLEARMNLKRFKILFFIPVIYIFFILVFIGLFINSFTSAENLENINLFAGILAIIFPLHLFSMFCMFHSLYFVAKTFKTAALQREVNFSEFALEFFLMWFYPIGIWIIQPKINEMIES